jgi:transcriptional regulator with XRE-family HTH domain
VSRRAVLTAEQARELRERYRLHAENTPRKLAAEFGLSRSAVLNYAKAGHLSRGYRREDVHV